MSVANTGITVTLENFQQVILEGSQSKLIIVDFWADWCEPCKQLMPVLEKLAAEYSDRVTLVKIDCDEQQQLAAQFGIRSLPTVAFFKEGQPVDGFAGVEPESAIRARIEQHIPGPGEDLLKHARELLEQEQFDEAYALAKQAYDLQPEDTQAQLTLADAACSLGRIEQTESLLDGIRLADQDSYFQQVQSKLQLAKQAADSPELRALQQQVKEQPDNLELALELATSLYQAKRMEEALEVCFSVLKRDFNFPEARQQALDMLNGLPKGDPLAARYRRLLYSMMY
ncbi:thioredoxin [Pseudidiomarina sp. 1APR75-15]|uniref:Thioredoxin n=1 Tax=Pseudidiomarina terrestris TaxID=2820060 RepID=A0ABT8MJZ8_9GAMM|nr:thioredoxin [Pseudidiomarina sp. 1APR75-33.1]MDN7130281.1 thioredoxin [Pseudidiomarina sp. 1APR75-15]MDN7136204.1 thioredoxin [Pseudidiomarina sp. 1ASP75-5]MEA3588658.1 thioredoxin [Pseudidiomarina sp. 1APP75-27a]